MITSNQVSLTSKQATTLTEVPADGASTEVTIKATFETFWIGDAEVTNDNGFIIKPFETLTLSLSPNDILYAYAINESKVYVLTTEM